MLRKIQGQKITKITAPLPFRQFTVEIKKRMKKKLRQRFFIFRLLTLSRRRRLSYRHQSTDLLRKSMNWFLYDNGLRIEKVKRFHELKSLCHMTTVNFRDLF